MSKFAAARAALKEGGASELVRRTRLWAAGRIYPGQMPSPRPPKKAKKRAGKSTPKAPARPAWPSATADDVAHAEAYAFFDGYRDIYERLADAVAPYIEPDGVFYDVGANIGYFTKMVAEKANFRGTVHLFEPVPNLVELCRETLADAPYTVVIHDFGLSSEDGSIPIFVSESGNLGWNTMVSDKASSGMIESEIQVRAFSTAGITDVPSFIKIDVEGAEHMVLAGMADALGSWSVKPVILCEIGWGDKHPQWAEELRAFERLMALGYSSFTLQGEPLDITSLSKTTDVLFLPASQ